MLFYENCILCKKNKLGFLASCSAMGLIENKRLAEFTSASVSSSSRGGSWWRWRWWRHVVRGRCRSGVHEELPVEEAEHNDPDDSRDDHHLQVLQPELVLHGRGLLLELGGAILEGVSSLLEGTKLVITVEPETSFPRIVFGTDGY